MTCKAILSKKILVVDDHPNFLSLTKLLLEEIGFKLIFTAPDFETAWKLYKRHLPDLCLLDIYLGEQSRTGIDLAEKIRIRDKNVVILFLTSNYTHDYYQEAVHVMPDAFMNKNLSRLKIQQAIELIFMKRAANNHTSNTQRTNEIPYFSDQNFFFKVGDHFKRIQLDKIAFFYAKDKFTYAAIENRNLPTTVQLKNLESELAPLFQRIHKSYLVNINFIDQINSKESTAIVNGKELPIGNTYRKAFFKTINLIK